MTYVTRGLLLVPSRCFSLCIFLYYRKPHSDHPLADFVVLQLAEAI